MVWPMLTTYIQLPCLFNAAFGMMNCDLVGHNCSPLGACACRLFLISVNGFFLMFGDVPPFVVSLFDTVRIFMSLLSTDL